MILEHSNAATYSVQHSNAAPYSVQQTQGVAAVMFLET